MCEMKVYWIRRRKMIEEGILKVKKRDYYYDEAVKYLANFHPLILNFPGLVVLDLSIVIKTPTKKELPSYAESLIILEKSLKFDKNKKKAVERVRHHTDGKGKICYLVVYEENEVEIFKMGSNPLNFK